MGKTGSGKPFFSVIVPVYRTETFFSECLASLRKQSYKHFECLIVDDGSPEGGDALSIRRIIQDQVGKDRRFRCIRQQRQGAPAARNTGLDQITGERVVFLDSDDYLEPAYLEKAYQALQDRPDGAIVFADAKILLPERTVAFSDFQRFIPHRHTLQGMLVSPAWTAMGINHFWETHLIRKYGIRFGAGPGEDTCFHLANMLAHFREYGRLAFVPVRAYYMYRQHAAQTTRQQGYHSELYRNYVACVTGKFAELGRAGRIYAVLAVLFITRFTLYRWALQYASVGLVFRALAWPLTGIALWSSGVRNQR